MKRNLFLAGLFSLFTVTQVSAITYSPFLTDDPGVVSPQVTLGTSTYDVINRSGTGDVWNSTYYGYEWDGSTGDGYSGYYIGTFSEDQGGSVVGEDVFFDIVDFYLGGADPLNWYKIDADGSTTSDDGVLSYTVDSSGKAGTWLTTDPNEVQFYAIKGSTEFSVYYLDPSTDTGIWSSRHLLNNGDNIPNISHFAAMVDPDISGEEPPPIPEPATMLLFGTGLAGLIGVNRKRKR